MYCNIGLEEAFRRSGGEDLRASPPLNEGERSKRLKGINHQAPESTCGWKSSRGAHLRAVLGWGTSLLAFCLPVLASSLSARGDRQRLAPNPKGAEWGGDGRDSAGA